MAPRKAAATTQRSLERLRGRKETESRSKSMSLMSPATGAVLYGVNEYGLARACGAMLVAGYVGAMTVEGHGESPWLDISTAASESTASSPATSPSVTQSGLPSCHTKVCSLMMPS